MSAVRIKKNDLVRVIAGDKKVDFEKELKVLT